MFRIGIVDLENEHLAAREQMIHGRPGVANRVRAGSPSSQSDGFMEHLVMCGGETASVYIKNNDCVLGFQGFRSCG